VRSVKTDFTVFTMNTVKPVSLSTLSHSTKFIVILLPDYGLFQTSSSADTDWNAVIVRQQQEAKKAEAEKAKSKAMRRKILKEGGRLKNSPPITVQDVWDLNKKPAPHRTQSILARDRTKR